MKKIAVLFLCLMLLCTCAACGEDSTSSDPYKGLTLYESETGISLYMEKGFTETTAEGVACAFEGENALVSCREESFETLEGAGFDSDITEADYAALLLEAHGFDGEVKTDSYGNAYFTYEQDVVGVSLTYFAFIDKGPESFWTTNFICPVENAGDMEDDFQLWASSIVIR